MTMAVLAALAGGVFGCRTALDPRAVAEVAAAAGRQVAGDTLPGGGGQTRVWTVAVATGVRDSADVLRHLRALLRARPRQPSDSVVETIVVDRAAATAGGLVLHVGLSTRLRCGPSWGTTVAWSGTYDVTAHRGATQWVVDSTTLAIDGAPTVCQDSSGRPFPPTT
jgi:hypothetical protein